MPTNIYIYEDFEAEVAKPRMRENPSKCLLPIAMRMPIVYVWVWIMQKTQAHRLITYLFLSRFLSLWHARTQYYNERNKMDSKGLCVVGMVDDVGSRLNMGFMGIVVNT